MKSMDTKCRKIHIVTFPIFSGNWQNKTKESIHYD